MIQKVEDDNEHRFNALHWACLVKSEASQAKPRLEIGCKSKSSKVHVASLCLKRDAC